MYTIWNSAWYIPRASSSFVPVIYFKGDMILIAGAILEMVIKKTGNMNVPNPKGTTKAILFSSLSSFS